MALDNYLFESKKQLGVLVCQKALVNKVNKQDKLCTEGVSNNNAYWQKKKIKINLTNNKNKVEINEISQPLGNPSSQLSHYYI